LAENAVRHGIGPLAAGGVVSIRSCVQDGSLTLQVSDTGAGARDDPAVDRRGRGLRLLRERLTGLYGDGATLITRTLPDQGFTATVTLPARRD
jgi:LytS/YehU family sensor histidine kinase